MKTTIKLATGKDLGCGAYRLRHTGIPGLLWAELVKLMDEYSRFEKGKRGTRFDTWL